ncbi:helix-turn-helix domain-containing protein [Streptomyces sp. NBC_00576]|uniref:helix-turn-helix domain-containing protein n=1 Tax=Streptomyces sp. NBC_00576 TaxID=2903665 RepID=UPI002E8119CE|nr:helix-turn-helix transcriptional regulator [Streptomyces sp. NBC_00576]WUB69316.1 helix-turn-helix domain-containing protein [Streptomyces sp. NBC_00576]
MPGRILALVGREGQTPPTSPKAAAQLIGALLRHLREQRGLHQGHVVGKVAGIGSIATLSRCENASGEPKPERVVALLRFYEAEEEVLAEAEALMRHSQGQRWWDTFTDVAENLHTSLFALEATSKVIRTYQQNHIPGMLQTAGYARAVMTHFFRAQHDPQKREKNLAMVERRLEMRRRRQHLLDQPETPAYEALVAEGVVAKEVGGVVVMREQLRHLFNLAENKPDVHIRILPEATTRQDAPVHPAMTLFKPYSDQTGRTLYLEQHNRGGELVADPSELETFQASMDDWWTKALSKQETLDRLQHYIDLLVEQPKE